MGEPAEHVRGGEDGQRVGDEARRLGRRAEQQRHLIPQQVHGRQPQHAQADGDQVVRVAEAAHAVGVARPVVLMSGCEPSPTPLMSIWMTQAVYDTTA